MVHFKNMPDALQALSIVYKVSQPEAVSVLTVGKGENNLMGLLETACLLSLGTQNVSFHMKRETSWRDRLDF
jgi:hypothetical protein